MSAGSRLTIVVPTLGREQVKRCISSIFDNVKESEEFDLIVVKNDRRGYTGPCNRGIRMAEEDSDIMVVGDDFEFKEPFIEKFYEKKRPGVGLIGLQTIQYGFQGRPLERLDFHCVFIPRETIDRVGLFDERYKFFTQDLDYCYRVRDVHDLRFETVDLKHGHGKSMTLGNRSIFPDINDFQKKENELFREKYFGGDLK